MRAIALQSDRVYALCYVISSTHTDNIWIHKFTCTIDELHSISSLFSKFNAILSVFIIPIYSTQYAWKKYTNQRHSAHFALHIGEQRERLNTSNLHLPHGARLPTLEFSRKKYLCAIAETNGKPCVDKRCLQAEVQNRSKSKFL